jgi:flagellar hook assembly protein FlgD
VRLIDGKQEQGQHGLTWDGRDGAGRSVSSGTYFYLLRTHRATLTRRMTLLR